MKEIIQLTLLRVRNVSSKAGNQTFLCLGLLEKEWVIVGMES